ncbi:BatA domain-containing protein [Pirellulaceae bacterium SH501]
MNFLSPVYALAALAVIAPVIFHLVRRRPKEKVTFSSLMFLDPAPPRLTRSSRIDHWILLLLRAAALLLVAAAFSRPYWDSPTAASSSQSGIRRVLLIDTSASMRRDGMLGAAKERAAEWIRKSSASDIISVYAFHEQIESLYSMSESLDSREGQRQALAIQSLEGLKPTWFSADLTKAIGSALDTAQVDSEVESDAPPQKIELVVISDFQQSMKLDELASIAWPSGTQFVPLILPQSSKQASNARALLLEDVDLSSDSPEAVSMMSGAAATEFRARISNGNESASEKFQLAWLDSQSKPLEGGPALESTVLRGKSQIVRLGTIPENAVCLELKGDSVSFDNRFYFAPKKRIPKKVLAVEKAGTEPSDELSYFLKQVPLGNEKYDVEFQRVDSLVGMTDEQWNDIVLVFASVQTSVQDLQRLKQFAEGGGHVVWVWDEPANDSDFDLEGIYQQVFGAPIGRVSEASVKQYAMLERIQFSSYLFQSLSDPKFNDFTKIRFWKHRDLELSEPDSWQILSSFDNRKPAILERKVGEGLWTIFAAGWQPRESQLALSSKFVPIVVNRVQASLPIARYANQMRVGDAMVVPSGVSLRDIARGNPVVIQSNEEVEWVADEPGLFGLEDKDKKMTYVAVNLSEAESESGQHDIQRIAQTGVPLSEPGDAERAAGMQRQLRAVELESNQSSWRWLLCSVLGLIGLESVWSIRRRTAEA